jgi:pimeloyl-ACP methyl ester carboxylesterase
MYAAAIDSATTIVDLLLAAGARSGQGGERIGIGEGLCEIFPRRSLKGSRMAVNRRTFLTSALAAPLAASRCVAAAAPQGARADVSPARRNVFVRHAYEERQVRLGEIEMNYVRVGPDSKPALLLIPAQINSWWSYETVLPLLASDFQCFAVDLRGQGRSSWTPRRYTIDNIGNDLVRFIDLAVGRPVVVSGNSSGCVAAAWLSAYAKPGQIRGAHYQDPPLLSADPASRDSSRGTQSGASEVFRLAYTYLGDQWSIGDWAGLRRAAATSSQTLLKVVAQAAEPPQNWKEYDPEWGRASVNGSLWAGCPHEVVLEHVKAPVLITHHARRVLADGTQTGAMSDSQASKVMETLKGIGVAVEYQSMPDAAHVLHSADAPRFAKAVTEWARRLPA